jgi:hypothetical protein
MPCPVASEGYIWSHVRLAGSHRLQGNCPLSHSCGLGARFYCHLTALWGRGSVSLPGLVGPPDVIAAMASARGIGADRLVVTMPEHLHLLETFCPATGVTAGGAELVVEEDVPMLAEWVDQFHTDVGLPGPNAEAVARAFVGTVWW